MIALLKRSVDQLMGRGEAAIAVPPMDGPLKPNHLIDNAEVVAELEDGSDLASDGERIWVAEGHRLTRFLPHGERSVVAEFEGPLTAIARLADGTMAVAVSGGDLQFVGRSRWRVGRREVGGRAMDCITAMAPMRDGSLVVTDSSGSLPPQEWARDLMQLGESGRICRITRDGAQDAELATRLRYPFGACEVNGDVWFSESWAHRVAKLQRGSGQTRVATVLDRLPAYPSRMSVASGGGTWLTLFAARRRLVELVLREDEYRRRMLAEVDPRYWVAPMLSSGRSYMEPLQGGNVKTLGISKPWAPPRSYGLVVRLGSNGLPMYSLHSRADGHHHGIVAAVEAHEHLYMLAKGAGLLLRIELGVLSQMAMA